MVPVSLDIWLLIGLAVVTGAAIQTATGMGFALVSAPVFVSVLSPTYAVASLLALTAASNVAAMVASGARAIQWWLVLRVLPASLAGLPAGVWILTVLPVPVLQAVIGAGVVGWVAVMVFRRTKVGRGEFTSDNASRPSAVGNVGIGLLCGMLTTTSGLNGPPLAAWFQRHLASSRQVKDSLQISFLFLTLAGLLVMALSTDLHIDKMVWPVVIGVAFMPVGAKVGHAIYRRMSEKLFRICLNAVVFAAGVVSLIGGLTTM